MIEALQGIWWHQSSVSRLLSCPRRFRLRYVDNAQAEIARTGWAAPRGTAQHAACELVLRSIAAGDATPTREQLQSAMIQAFDDAIARAQDEGAVFEPEDLDRALGALDGEDLERMERFAQDRRLRAIRWEGIEHSFELVYPDRKWRGTIDAYGTATEYVPQFGREGRESVDLYPGDKILVDWKSGYATPLGRIARALNTQLAIYDRALGGPRRRLFVGNLRDLDQPKRPRDEFGQAIPKHLPKEPNPAFAEAVGIPLDQVASSKKRPRGIPKWLPERVNPAYEAALNQPKGPLFRECRVDLPRALETVRDAVRMAESGFYPATGVYTGACEFCEYARACVPLEEE